MDERERSIIAAHEVGHAICGKVHGDKRRVEEISLFAHGEALGVTVSSQEDNDLPSESDLRARLVALMGGRAAEELLFHEVTGGASNDFEEANQIATAMVTKWGMGRDPEAADGGISGRGALSFLVADRRRRSLPSEVQAAATRAIRSILDEAYAEACRTLIDHMDTLRRLAAYLVEHERVDGDDVRRAVRRPRDRSRTPATSGAPRRRGRGPGARSSTWRPVGRRPSRPDRQPFLTSLRPPRRPRRSARRRRRSQRGRSPSRLRPARSRPSPARPSRRSSRRRRRSLAVEIAAVRRRAPSRASETRVRVRRKAARRARGVAAGLLHRAERWLRSGELEATASSTPARPPTSAHRPRRRSATAGSAFGEPPADEPAMPPRACSVAPSAGYARVSRRPTGSSSASGTLPGWP